MKAKVLALLACLAMAATLGACGSTPTVEREVEEVVEKVIETCAASVEAYVWLDENANGGPDADEQPLPGVRVSYSHSSLSRGSTHTTDANGETYFVWKWSGPCDRVSNDYEVWANTPEGYQPTTPIRLSTTGTGDLALSERETAQFGFVPDGSAATPSP